MVAKLSWFYDPGILYVKKNFFKNTMLCVLRKFMILEDKSNFIIERNNIYFFMKVYIYIIV